MIEKLKKICRLICIVAVIGILPVSVQAAEKMNHSCSVVLPVSVSMENAEKTDSCKVEFKLVPEEKGTPMPKEDAIQVDVKNGNGSGQFGEILYQIPGEYRYIVSQVKGNSKNMEYDSSRYEVIVRVTNGDNGDLVSEIWAVRDHADSKTDEIIFVNRQAKEVQPSATAKPTVSQSTSTVVSHSVKTVSSPKTGDNTPVEVFVGILILAAVTAVSAVILRKKHKNP